MTQMGAEEDLNRQGKTSKDAKVVEKDLSRTHAALTGRCRSGGSADTLIREFIRVSGCPPIHVRIADSAAFMDNPFPIRVHPCESVVLSLRFSSPHLRQSAVPTFYLVS